MEKRLKILSVFCLLAVYTLVIGLSNNYRYYVKSYNGNSNHESSYSLISDNWLCPTTLNKKSINTGPWFFKPLIKLLKYDLPTILKYTEFLNCSFFLQYSFFEKNILERLRQPDIIFPFHYFL